MSHYTATGNLGKDPELTFTPSGKAVTRLSVAVNHSRKNQSGEWEQIGTTWVGVQLWEEAAQIAANALQKGDRLMIEGRLITRSYTRKDGGEATALELEYPTVAKVLPKRTENPAGAVQPQAAANPWGAAQASEPPF